MSKQGRIERPPPHVRFAELRRPDRTVQEYAYTTDERPRLPAVIDLLHLGALRPDDCVLHCIDSDGTLAPARPLVHSRWEFVAVEERPVPNASPRAPQTVAVAVYRPQQKEADRG